MSNEVLPIVYSIRCSSNSLLNTLPSMPAGGGPSRSVPFENLLECVGLRFAEHVRSSSLLVLVGVSGHPKDFWAGHSRPRWLT